jgi:hypothetical protein
MSMVYILAASAGLFITGLAAYYFIIRPRLRDRAVLREAAEEKARQKQAEKINQGLKGKRFIVSVRTGRNTVHSVQGEIIEQLINNEAEVRYLGKKELDELRQGHLEVVPEGFLVVSGVAWGYQDFGGGHHTNVELSVIDKQGNIKAQHCFWNFSCFEALGYLADKLN